MTYVVTQSCIGVKGEACIAVCPELCIFTESDDLMSYIDPARCTDCGACQAACVVGAIFPERELPRDALEFSYINRDWFRHKRGVRQRVRELACELEPWLETGADWGESVESNRGGDE